MPKPYEKVLILLILLEACCSHPKSPISSSSKLSNLLKRCKPCKSCIFWLFNKIDESCKHEFDEIAGDSYAPNVRKLRDKIATKEIEVELMWKSGKLSAASLNNRKIEALDRELEREESKYIADKLLVIVKGLVSLNCTTNEGNAGNIAQCEEDQKVFKDELLHTQMGYLEYYQQKYNKLIDKSESLIKLCQSQKDTHQPTCEREIITQEARIQRTRGNLRQIEIQLKKVNFDRLERNSIEKIGKIETLYDGVKRDKEEREARLHAIEVEKHKWYNWIIEQLDYIVHHTKANPTKKNEPTRAKAINLEKSSSSSSQNSTNISLTPSVEPLSRTSISSPLSTPSLFTAPLPPGKLFSSPELSEGASSSSSSSVVDVECSSSSEPSFADLLDLFSNFWSEFPLPPISPLSLEFMKKQRKIGRFYDLEAAADPKR